jgi:hypothetical protein
MDIPQQSDQIRAGRRFNGAMRLHEGRVRVAAGDGVVAREGATILLASAAPGPQEQLTDRLLELVTGHERLSGPSLVRMIGALVTRAAAEDLPDLGLITPSGDEVLVLLSGDVHLEVDVDGSTEHHHGREATTYVERMLPGDLTSLRMYVAEHTEVDARSNLANGVVRGNGFLVRPDVAEPAPPAAGSGPTGTVAAFRPPTPASERDDQTPPAFTRISLFGDDPQDDPAAAVATEPASGIQIRGVVCSRGHFTNPDLPTCVRCGTAVVGQPETFLGPRPPLGTLVNDQGEEFLLARDQVVGRDPSGAEEVVTGRAAAIVLQDPELSASRIHARVILDGWEVRVEDASSGNGTFIAAPGRDWQRLEPGRPVTMVPGTRVAFGSREFLFQSPR